MPNTAPLRANSEIGPNQGHATSVICTSILRSFCRESRLPERFRKPLYGYRTVGSNPTLSFNKSQITMDYMVDLLAIRQFYIQWPPNSRQKHLLKQLVKPLRFFRRHRSLVSAAPPHPTFVLPFSDLVCLSSLPLLAHARRSPTSKPVGCHLSPHNAAMSCSGSRSHSPSAFIH